MKIPFVRKSPEEILKKDKKYIFNFINLHDIWWFKNNNLFRESLQKENNLNLSDGRVLSWFLITKQQRGPGFTKEFLFSKEAGEKRHFFIGLEKSDLIEISEITRISIKDLFYYNPSYIKEIEFSEKERKNIISLIKKIRPDFVWVCIGCPKQNILSVQLFDKYKATYFNVGAATDFLLGKKKESPFIFRKVGLEWFYRFITDFKYSKKKVWRSFVGLCYLVSWRVGVESKEQV